MAGAVDHVHVASELDRAGVAQRLLAKAWRIYIGNYCTVLKECGPKAVLHDAHTVAYLHRPDLYNVEKLTLEVSVGGASNGHSLLDRRTLSSSDDEIDDRTGEIGERKRRCLVLVGVDAAGFKGAFLNAVAPPLVNVSLPIVKETTRRFVHVHAASKA